MLLQSTTIARNTFVESLRQPVTLMLVLLAAVLIILSTWTTGYSLGYASTESSEVQSDNKLLFDIGLSTVFGLGTILAGFIATSALSKEIENRTILTIVSKPVSRVAVVLGKFLGVAGALLWVTLIMLVFLLMGIRHGVMETAADSVDIPVVTFGAIAFFLALGLGAWCNFFYGWNFPQTALTILLPAIILAYVGVLLVGKEWRAQPISTDWKPQVITACLCLTLAVLVLSAVATAASTRLGQVMTIVVCVGVFALSLLSNYFVGRHVFDAQPIAQVQRTEPSDIARNFKDDQSPIILTLMKPPARPIAPGTTIYYSPSAQGFPLMHDAPARPFSGNLENPNEVVGDNVPGAIIATAAQGMQLTLRNVGGTPLPVLREPEQGDFLFDTKTKVRLPALAIWGSFPNVQFFWLLDAVSQNHRVPLPYLGLSVAYAGVQVVLFLSLAVMLFQRRDVG
jgi:ABC-type transport system involved in multi-copper enzyme maturation permease subunit